MGPWKMISLDSNLVSFWISTSMFYFSGGYDMCLCIYVLETYHVRVIVLNKNFTNIKSTKL